MSYYKEFPATCAFTAAEAKAATRTAQERARQRMCQETCDKIMTVVKNAVDDGRMFVRVGPMSVKKAVIDQVRFTLQDHGFSVKEFIEAEYYDTKTVVYNIEWHGG